MEVKRLHKYENIDLQKLEMLAREGHCDDEISRRLGISRSTFYRYKKEFPAFEETLRRGKQRTDSAVEEALFRKATGYVQRIVKPVKVKEVLYENGKKAQETERVEMVVEEQYFPPDTNSALFWLKNRCPDRWQDGSREQEDELDHLSPEAAVAAVRRSIAQITKSIGDSDICLQEKEESEC